MSGLIDPADRAHAHGWLQLGGAGFVISTVQVNAYLGCLRPAFRPLMSLLVANRGEIAIRVRGRQ